MKASAALLTAGLFALPLPITGPAPAPPAAAPAPTPGVYSPSARGDGHWTWPGDLREHLRRTHGIDASQMSDQQAMALHDADHVRRPQLGRHQASSPARPANRAGRPTYAASHGRR